METPMFLTMRTTTDDHAHPPHPGAFITEVYLIPNNLSGRELASQLGVAASTLNRVLKGSSGISPDSQAASPQLIRSKLLFGQGATKRRWRPPHKVKRVTAVFWFRFQCGSGAT